MFMANALMENGNGLRIDYIVSGATVTAELGAVLVILDDAWQRGFRPRTFGAERGYDARKCVKAKRGRGVMRMWHGERTLRLMVARHGIPTIG